jgi:ABC-type branched-subunit amino acid transport system permease subunit
VKVGKEQYKLAVELLDNQSDVSLSVHQYVALLARDKVNFLLGPFASDFAIANSTRTRTYGFGMTAWLPSKELKDDYFSDAGAFPAAYKARFGLLWLLLNRARLGRAIRATTQSLLAAQLYGVEPRTLYAVTLGIGAALAGAAGGLYGVVSQVNPYIGATLTAKSFAITSIGGYCSYASFGNSVFYGLGSYGTGIAMAQFGLPFAFGLMAIRENEEAAAVMGINTRLYKVVALALSALFAALAGGIHAYWITFVDPASSFDITLNVKMIIMAIFGGAGSILGPVIRAFVLLGISEILATKISTVASLFVGLGARAAESADALTGPERKRLELAKALAMQTEAAAAR